jgi:hypothetical protein
MKLFETVNKQEFEEVVEKFTHVLEAWVTRHPEYKYSIDAYFDNGVFKIKVLCNDITAITTRLN